ncbi:MAG TPA: polysaccharide biosynthesis/export family protein [Caulobacteraceae bacterium]
MRLPWPLRFAAILSMALTSPAAAQEYRIGALDTLDVTVFQVKDLTLEKLQVDAGGKILLPLIGQVTAQGKTTGELSAEIAARLAAHYLQDPQVSVVVHEAVSQKISVEGAVNQAGVFPMKGRTSLLEAVAMARGFSKDANAHKVAIVREVGGVEQASTFDLAAIERGAAPDPQVQGSDTVVVASSGAKTLWHGFIESIPGVNALGQLGNGALRGAAAVPAAAPPP